MPIIARMRSRYCGGSAIGRATAVTMRARTSRRGSCRDIRHRHTPASRARTSWAAACRLAGGCSTALRPAFAQDARRLQGEDDDQHEEGYHVLIGDAETIERGGREDSHAERLDNPKQDP